MNRIVGIFFALSIYSPSLLGASLLQPASFPTTSMDATFIERRDSAAAGYKPFTNRSAYQPVIIESEQKYMLRHAESVRKSDLASMTTAQYCSKYPLDATRCVQKPDAYESTIKIGDRPSVPTTTPPTTTPTPTPTTTPTPTPTPTTTPTPTPTTTPTQPQAPAPSKPHHNINDNQVVRMGPQNHNGPCTPPQRSDVFSNKILTSGQYQQSDPAFEKTMITTFRAEGGCGNHPNDSGGYTCYGISQNNNPEVDVRNITRADAENIAHRKYYTKYGLDKLPDYIRSDVFTFGWVSGPVTAIHNLCRVLGLPERNKIDSEIVMATENYNGDLHNDYLDAMQQYFIKCAQKPKQDVFLTGWMNRVKFTRENSCHYPTTDPIYR